MLYEVLYKDTSTRLAATEIVNRVITRKSTFKYKIIHVRHEGVWRGGGKAPLSNLVLDGGDWSASTTEPFAPGERAASTH
jgi:hypothetical protein